MERQQSLLAPIDVRSRQLSQKRKYQHTYRMTTSSENHHSQTVDPAAPWSSHLLILSGCPNVSATQPPQEAASLRIGHIFHQNGEHDTVDRHPS
jgi:hypothetical protein